MAPIRQRRDLLACRPTLAAAPMDRPAEATTGPATRSEQPRRGVASSVLAPYFSSGYA